MSIDIEASLVAHGSYPQMIAATRVSIERDIQSPSFSIVYLGMTS